MNTNTFTQNNTDQTFPLNPAESAAGLELHHAAPEDLLLNSTLNSVLDDLCERGCHAIEPISNHICSMQEMLLNILYERLEEAGIDLSVKLTIGLAPGGKLGLMDDRPDRKEIETILAETPGLGQLFAILAAHSEIARDIVNINQIFHSLTDQSVTMCEKANGYQVSLQGGMSHFYFVQRS